MGPLLKSSGKSTWHRWLLVIPFLWQIGGVVPANEIAWRPFSLPFPMVWQMVGIVVASLVIALVFAIDRRRGLHDDDETDEAA
jgi:hypothetical protein